LGKFGCIFISLGYTPKAGIVRHTDTVHLLGNCHTVFSSGYTILQPLQQCMKVSISLQPRQQFFVGFLFCFGFLWD
jgi:hypothetical protein